MQGRPDGNRQDNRQRGNAAQLLEKYKAMARDSQLAGDRVQTEYYLQFADHYFRVLEDGRSRFEDQQTRRRGNDDEDEDGDEIGASADGDYEDEGEDEPRPAPRRDRPAGRDRVDEDQRPQRAERADRDQRPQRPERADRDQRPEQDQRAERPDQDQRPPRPERPRRDRANGIADEPADERISLGVLPPAIGIGTDTNEVAVEAPRPRRRVRKPREADEGDEIAPAA